MLLFAIHHSHVDSLFCSLQLCKTTNIVEFFYQQATSWKLEEAIQLFYVGGEGGMVSSGTHTQPRSNDPMAAQSWGYDKLITLYFGCCIIHFGLFNLLV